jgi:hypothetical protein
VQDASTNISISKRFRIVSAKNLHFFLKTKQKTLFCFTYYLLLITFGSIQQNLEIKLRFVSSNLTINVKVDIVKWQRQRSIKMIQFKVLESFQQQLKQSYVKRKSWVRIPAGPPFMGLGCLETCKAKK